MAYTTFDVNASFAKAVKQQNNPIPDVDCRDAKEPKSSDEEHTECHFCVADMFGMPEDQIDCEDENSNFCDSTRDGITPVELRCGHLFGRACLRVWVDSASHRRYNCEVYPGYPDKRGDR